MENVILESPKDSILQEDLEGIASSNIPVDSLRGKSVFITGATGLIGSQIVKALACCNRLLDTKIQILAFVRSKAKAEQVFGELLVLDSLQLVLGDIGEELSYEGKVDYVIHGASATSSKFFVSNPVETILTAVNGTKNVLEFAKSKGVEGFLYLSSLEVYGTPDKDAALIAEDYSGYIDCLQVRSSYSEGKRLVECLCASYSSEYSVPVKIARLSQTFGSGVEYDDGRVFAEFGRCALEGKNIVLHTQGNTVRSYCYTKDAIEALLFILIKGNPGEAYNVTNMETKISIREMAELVCKTFPDAGISVEIDIPKDVASFGYNPEMIIALDSTKLMNLGWKASTDLSSMFRRLTKSMLLRKPE